MTALCWLELIWIFIGLNEHPVERLLLDETQLGALVKNLLYRFHCHETLICFLCLL